MERAPSWGQHRTGEELAMTSAMEKRETRTSATASFPVLVSVTGEVGKTFLTCYLGQPGSWATANIRWLGKWRWPCVSAGAASGRAGTGWAPRPPSVPTASSVPSKGTSSPLLNCRPPRRPSGAQRSDTSSVCGGPERGRHVKRLRS